MDGIYPVLFNLYLLRLGYGPEFVGTVNSVGLLGYALFALPAGALSARWGVRRAMIAGLSVFTISYTLIPLVAFVPPALQDATMLVLRLIASVGMALNFVSSLPFLMNATRPDERDHVYSVRTAMWPLAGFLGSLIGGVLPGVVAPILGLTLDDAAPYRYPLLLASILCIPAVLAIMATREREEVHEEASQAPMAANSSPMMVIAVMMLIALLRPAAVGAARTFFNVYLDDGLGMPTAQIGTLYAAIQLITTPVVLVMPLLVSRWGHFRTVVGSSLGVIASTLLLALIPHWGAAMLGRLGISALSSIEMAAITIYQMEIVPPRWRATMVGATNTAFGLSWAAVSFGGGYLITVSGYTAVFLAAAAMTLVGISGFWLYFHVPRGEFSSSLGER